MKIGVQIGQVVAQGYDLQRQWLEQLEHFRACRDAGFDFVSWGHHWLIHPFQHFQHQWDSYSTMDKQQIQVGKRCELSSTVSTDSNDGHSILRVFQGR